MKGHWYYSLRPVESVGCSSTAVRPPSPPPRRLQLPLLDQEVRFLLVSSARPGTLSVGRRGGAPPHPCPPPLEHELCLTESFALLQARSPGSHGTCGDAAAPAPLAASPHEIDSALCFPTRDRRRRASCWSSRTVFPSRLLAGFLGHRGSPLAAA